MAKIQPRATAKPPRTDAESRFPWHQGKIRERLQELQDAGCKKEEIEGFLISLSLVASAGLSEGVGTVPHGFTRRRLKYLTTPLRQLAKDVEHLNANKYYDPEQWLPPTGLREPSARTVFLRDFTLLPRILERYADYLEVRNKILGGFRRGPGKGPFFKRQIIRALMRNVRDATGRAFYGALADLLSTALPDDLPLNEDALRKLDARHTGRRSVESLAIDQ